MNKADLVDAIATATGSTKADAAKAVDAFVGAVSTALAAGDKVAVPGLGVFSVADRAAREGRNVKTGEKIQIAATRVAKFKVGAELKRAVAG